MVSVINQMLKDLEQRTPAQGQVAMPVAISNKPSTIKIVLISVAVLVSLNLLGFYIWNLQEQIQQQTQQVKQRVSSSELIVAEQELKQEQKQVQVQPEVLTSELIVEAQELKQEQKQAQIQQQELSNEAKTPVKAKVEIAKVTASKMSVSRRQLTSAELVAQKLIRAEKSIKINEITKAEQLFEEVLIIEPNHKQARKKLAALWFGRRSYQQATNLLSQGISLDRSDAQLRLLKAKIHLQQGQHQAAYNTLKPLAVLKQQEYQLMLANVAQQIKQYKSAIQAYKILINMQSYSGRWHLGLAIVYDKNSQFSLAITEYALALTKSDLSIATAEFAEQRMQALGE
ncbi:MAG: tetratricopeptide repeat protein [Colwellia sp.]|nr:tetratricopeptide repeat protein [Colwellia sp.]